MLPLPVFAAWPNQFRLRLNFQQDSGEKSVWSIRRRESLQEVILQYWPRGTAEMTLESLRLLPKGNQREFRVCGEESFHYVLILIAFKRTCGVNQAASGTKQRRGIREQEHLAFAQFADVF